MIKKTSVPPLARLLGPFLACLALLAAPARADEVTIKLGTLAPSGSPWHVLLKEAAQRWEQASGGQVHLKIFAGGVMGNEGDMKKKIEHGTLQAAALSTIGLHEITPEALAVDLPLLVQSHDEHDYLIGKIGERLEAALAKKGYVVLSWSEIGLVHFFSTEPRPSLDKMRQGKLFTWEGDPASLAAWKAGGFHTVVLSATDIIPSLQTGMIDTVAYPPAVALGIRLHDKAKYMSDMVWSGLSGATVVDKKTWERVPEAVRPQLLAVIRELGKRTGDQGRKMEDEALTKMKAQGLHVVHVTDLPEWQKAVDDQKDAIRGKVVPADLFDEVHRLIKEYRAGRK